MMDVEDDIWKSLHQMHVRTQNPFVHMSSHIWENGVEQIPVQLQKNFPCIKIINEISHWDNKILSYIGLQKLL